MTHVRCDRCLADVDVDDIDVWDVDGFPALICFYCQLPEDEPIPIKVCEGDKEDKIGVDYLFIACLVGHISTERDKGSAKQ